MAGETQSEDGFREDRNEQIKEMHMVFKRWKEGLKNRDTR